MKIRMLIDLGDVTTTKCATKNGLKKCRFLDTSSGHVYCEAFNLVLPFGNKEPKRLKICREMEVKE